MVHHTLPFAAAAESTELFRATTIAAVALLILVLAMGVGGFVLLFRRGGDRGIRGRGSQSQLDAQAASALIALDDRVREADLELGFAIAQFGASSTLEFQAVLASARQELAEAFRLGHARETTSRESERVTRANTLQIIALCKKSLSRLDTIETSFAARRHSEVDAGATANSLNSQLATARDRLAQAQAHVTTASTHYVPPALQPLHSPLTRATEYLAQAERQLQSATSAISPSGVNAVSDLLHEASIDLHRAENELASCERGLTELADTDAAVEQLRNSSRADIAEARAVREMAPDPQNAETIAAAIAELEAAISSTAPQSNELRDPLSRLNALSDAAAALDHALASARNQQQRFDHARAAYEGTLVAARSQISVVKGLMSSGRASARARTRLAEAERQLMIAEAETDPVEALDAIRRSVTHARDADALARY